MDRHGGPVAIRGQLDQTHEVSVELDLQFIDVDESFRELDNALVSGTYKLVISYSGGAAFPKVHESFKVTSKDRGQASGFEASNGIATFDNEEPRPYPPNWLFLRAYG
jgi:hypothetical protein